MEKNQTENMSVEMVENKTMEEAATALAFLMVLAIDESHIINPLTEAK